MDFAYELIYVQEIFVYLRFSWSGEQVFFLSTSRFLQLEEPTFLRH